MARYKVLRSVAHNLGHSYLSLVNWAEGDYVVEHLYQRAREAGEPVVRVDVLRGTIAPDAFATPVLLASAERLRAWFGPLVQSQGAALDMVSAARLEVTFDLARPGYSRHVPGLELAVYACVVEILDDRGRRHVATVPEWWRT